MFGDDVLARLRRTKTLPEAIGIAVKAAGSHDRLAKQLKTSRQTIINWEKGVYPSRYKGALINIGIPARYFVTVDKTDVERRLRRMEAEIAAIRKEIE